MPELTPELQARITMARSVVAEFERAEDDWLNHGKPAPEFAGFAYRMLVDLKGLLDQIERER